MNKRKAVVAMSWAMRQNKNEDAIHFSKELVSLLSSHQTLEQIVFPSMGTIQAVAPILHANGIGLGAQNIAPYSLGEYSGEYSIESLLDIQGKYVELGHWERRKLFGETDELINRKLLLALEHRITPIVCIGETKVDSDQAIFTILKKQLFNDLFGIKAQQCQKLILAYTPQWAVGKARAANAPHIHHVAGMIRQIIAELYDELAANNVRIIYGGSVSPENAGLIVKNSAVDGVLVGRFGSEPIRFAQVVQEVEKAKLS